MLTPREAARLLGVSYATVKQWILSGKLKTVQTPGDIIVCRRRRCGRF